MIKKKKKKSNLRYYFEYLMSQTSAGYNSDNDAEIGFIIEEIERYVDERIKQAIEELRRR